MLHMLIGPVLLVSGLLIVFAAGHGLPAGLRLERMPAGRRRAGITPADTLVVEMLSEMLHLREQLAELQHQVGTAKVRPRKTAKLAG